MREIKLTQGKVALVDDDMFDELNQFKWIADRGRKTFYARRWNGERNIKMHHILLPPIFGYVTDHIDRSCL